MINCLLEWSLPAFLAQVQTSKTTIFWPSIPSYQEKDAYAHTCKNQFSHVSIIRILLKKNLSALSSVRFSWGGGQAAQARVSLPPGGKLPRSSFSPGVAAQGGGKIPWGICTTGGQAAPRQLHPPGGGGGGKLPRVQDKPVHRLKYITINL